MLRYIWTVVKTSQFGSVEVRLKFQTPWGGIHKITSKRRSLVGPDVKLDCQMILSFTFELFLNSTQTKLQLDKMALAWASCCCLSVMMVKFF